ncbi:MAG: tyrosine-protein phosphatase [Comamonadaceae bacterium]|nr:tyrosine-protein phosphatase [Comamonadaceae bacterium]
MPLHPDRALPLDGASNFRDLGGYPAAGGHRTRWRRLFRADHLGALTPDDAARLRTLGVARTVDFRATPERAARPYALTGVVQHALPIEPAVTRHLQALQRQGRAVTPAVMASLMQDTYRAFVHDNTAAFAGLFERLMESDDPLVFHCTAGKDRTGLAAALVLLALEVPREVVMQDYLLTNQLYRMPPLQDHPLLPRAAQEVLWRVQRGFLQAALDAVDAQPGGADGWLRRALGLGAPERRRLAALYLD